MRRFFYYILLLISAILVALLLPRELPTEFRWEKTWERSLTEAGMEPERSSSVSPEFTLVVTTETDFYRLNTETGQVLSSGIRVREGRFAASSFGYINQDPDVPRWAVQRWGDDPPVFLDAVGEPVIVGDVVIQQSTYGGLFVTDLSAESDGDWLLPPLDGEVAYDYCDSCDPAVIARGNLFGDVEVFHKGVAEPFTYRVPFDPYSGGVPLVYGVAVLSPDRILLLSGKDPQRIRILAIHEGGIDSLVSVPVSEEDQVRRPTDIAHFAANETVLVQLQNHAIIVNLESFTATRLPIPGEHTFRKGGRGGGLHFFVYSDASSVRTILTSLGDDEIVEWEWRGLQVVVPDLQSSSSRVVFLHDELVFAIEATL